MTIPRRPPELGPPDDVLSPALLIVLAVGYDRDAPVAVRREVQRIYMTHTKDELMALGRQHYFAVEQEAKRRGRPWPYCGVGLRYPGDVPAHLR